MHCGERKRRPGPRMTLEVPDTVGQEGATGFTGSSSQSSPTSLLPPVLMTKLTKHPPPRCRARQAPRKRTGGEAGRRGTVEGRRHLSGHETSEDRASKAGRAAVVGKGQETSFQSSQRRHSCCQHQVQRVPSWLMGAWSPSLPIFQADLP